VNSGIERGCCIQRGWGLAFDEFLGWNEARHDNSPRF